MVIWFTGLSSSGKSTLARAVQVALQSRGHRQAVWLDGDLIRHCLYPELGFSRADRDLNVLRLGLLARLLVDQGFYVLVSAISPYRAARVVVRHMVGFFVEVYVDAPLAVCESRDVKGLYKRARLGEIGNVTGIDDPYEAPLNPEVVCQTDMETVEQSVAKVMEQIVR
jgi:adenylylsulfate kinase